MTYILLELIQQSIYFNQSKEFSTSSKAMGKTNINPIDIKKTQRWLLKPFIWKISSFQDSEI
jgi:hypothetical protein